MGTIDGHDNPSEGTTVQMSFCTFRTGFLTARQERGAKRSAVFSLLPSLSCLIPLSLLWEIR